MESIYNSVGKFLTYNNCKKLVKDVRCKYGKDIQVMFDDNSILTVSEDMVYNITID